MANRPDPYDRYIVKDGDLDAMLFNGILDELIFARIDQKVLAEATSDAQAIVAALPKGGNREATVRVIRSRTFGQKPITALAAVTNILHDNLWRECKRKACATALECGLEGLRHQHLGGLRTAARLEKAGFIPTTRRLR